MSLRDDTGVKLRATLLTERVDVISGVPTILEVEVQNPSDVIESVDARMVMPDVQSLVTAPSSLALFPGESGRLAIEVRFFDDLAAGPHAGILELRGRSGDLVSAVLPVRLHVGSSPRASVTAEPPVVSGGRRGRFDVLVSNDGNAPVIASIRSADADRALDLRLSAASVELQPGEQRQVELHARGRRPWTGSPVEHTITIGIQSDELEDTTQVQFRQRPRLTAGLITALTLALIVALWAAAMFFGVTTALASGVPTKELPETFAAGEGVGVEDLDPAAVGGAVTGTVTAMSTGQPVSRITVEAFDGRGRLAGATTTDEEGVYELTALLPTRYRVRFRAPGFDETWFPDAPTPEGASPVSIIPDDVVFDIDAAVTGRSSSLGGQVIAGDGDAQSTTVLVTPLDVLGDPAPRTTSTDAGGLWSLDGLVAPATYRITYTSQGYAPVDVTEPLDAGTSQVVNTVRLPAADGTLSGLVVDLDGEPIGGVEIEASSGDQVLTTTTPTSGAVGTFSFIELPTPATYLLTFRAPDAADVTQAVRLGPGQELSDVQITLAPTLGVVAGTVTDADGRPLGGVDVSLSGTGSQLTTQTFTSGEVGGYELGGVPVPGTYAVTFSLDGFTSQTVQVELTAEDASATVGATLVATRGIIAGVVVDQDSGEPLDGVTIEVSDGDMTILTTTASGPGDERGRFTVTDLPVGTYTITARIEDTDRVTLLREVRPDQVTDVRIEIDAQR